MDQIVVILALVSSVFVSLSAYYRYKASKVDYMRMQDGTPQDYGDDVYSLGSSTNSIETKLKLSLLSILLIFLVAISFVWTLDILNWVYDRELFAAIIVLIFISVYLISDWFSSPANNSFWARLGLFFNATFILLAILLLAVFMILLFQNSTAEQGQTLAQVYVLYSVTSLCALRWGKAVFS